MKSPPQRMISIMPYLQLLGVMYTEGYNVCSFGPLVFYVQKAAGQAPTAYRRCNDCNQAWQLLAHTFWAYGIPFSCTACSIIYSVCRRHCMQRVQQLQRANGQLLVLCTHHGPMVLKIFLYVVGTQSVQRVIQLRSFGALLACCTR